MIIVEKNVGPKIGYEVNNKSVCLDDDLTINLAKRQKDWPVHIDVCSDVVQFDIPATEYSEPETEEETPTALPLDMDKVTMTLWALENRPTEE